MKAPSPVRSEAYRPIEAPVSEDAKVQASSLATLKGIAKEDVRLYLERLGEYAGASRVPSAIAHIPAPARAPKSTPAGAETFERDLAGLGRELSKIYADGLVTEEELMGLVGLRSRMQDILRMRDDGALQMLPREVRQRLESSLFEPLGALLEASGAHTRQVLGEIGQRDAAPLAERTAEGVTRYQGIDFERLMRDGISLRGSDRYAAGDLVLIPRSSGQTTIGIVVGREADGLRVELPKDGGAGVKVLDPAGLVHANPLKLGDAFSLDGRDYWITGVGADGRAKGVSRDAAGRVEALDGAALEAIAQVLADRIGHLSPSRGVKKEAVPDPGSAHVELVAGGAEAKDVRTIYGRSFRGGLYTSRGPTNEEHGFEYKPYNEDAAVGGVLPTKGGSELAFAGALDQAGGMGQIPGQTGAASRMAAEEIEKAAKRAAEGEAPRAALEEAVLSAHRRIQAANAEHGVEAITTMAGAIVKDGRAHVVNVGDSKVWHFSKDGRLKNETASQNLGDIMAAQAKDPNAGLHVSNVVTGSLGARKQDPEPELTAWALERGDYLVFGSDGIGDANLAAQKGDVQDGERWSRTHGELTTLHVGSILAKAPSAESAAAQIRDFALEQMVNGRAKPDNITAVVVQVA